MATKTKRPMEQIYERVAPVYNFIYGKVLFNEGRRTAIDLLEIQANDCVLEVGVGTGLTLPMYPQDCKVVGIDLSESMLEEAKVLIEKQHIRNASVQLMNANQLKFPDNHFDGVLGNLFISATSDPIGALAEMKRVCRPGGHLVLMNHFRSPNPMVARMERMIGPLARRMGFDSALELEPLLERSNLQVKCLRKVNLFDMWTAVSMINNKSVDEDDGIDA